MREAGAAWRRCHTAIMGQEAAGMSRRRPADKLSGLPLMHPAPGPP
jgi:hypothetical protein